MKSIEYHQLPEGIEEALPRQAGELERHRRQVLDCFECWGYALVSPPLVEFHDALVTGKDALDRQTFRLTDTLSGRMLGVRTDITPQVARVDRQQMPQNRMVRLCYAGSVLRAYPEILGGGRNPIQVGAELYGHEGVRSDAEIVLLLCAALRVAGCTCWCLDMGHAGVFQALVGRMDWSAEERAELFGLVQRKACADLESWLSAHPAAEPVAKALRALPNLSGPGEEVLEQAAGELEGMGDWVAPALEVLHAVAGRVRRAYPEARIHFDLAESSGFRYENGLVFAAYMEGQGQEIARGGRYSVFGTRPAVGFSLDLRTLAQCGSLSVAGRRRVYAGEEDDTEQQEKILELRGQGHTVICGFGPEDNAQVFQCTQELVNEDGVWTVRQARP